MDFERVLRALLAEFDRHNIRYAAIGGFAMGILGALRATMDLDFLVHRDDLSRLHDALTGLGYRRHMHTENVSQYRHSDNLWGSLDFIHAFRKSSLAMLARAKAYPVFGSSQTVMAADPEDVIGLKVQAVANDPTRRSQDTADIEQLMELHGAELDWERVEEFYDLFGLANELKPLRKRFERPQ